MEVNKRIFPLSPLMKAFSVVFSGLLFSKFAFAAQCGAGGGTVTAAETANCTISTAGSTLSLNAEQTGWLRFTGGNSVLNIASGGALLVPASYDFAAISAYNPVGSLIINNKGVMEIQKITADMIYASSGGKYSINNAGQMKFTGSSADWNSNIFNSRGANDVSLNVNNTGVISNPGAMFNFEGGNNHAVNIVNGTGGSLTSTNYDIIYSSGSGISPVSLTNLGEINASRYVVYQSTPDKNSTFDLVNEGKINANGSGNTFQVTTQGAVNFNNSGEISSTKQGFMLFANTSDNVAVINGDNGKITTDGRYVYAPVINKSNTLKITNGENASVTSTGISDAIDFIYTLGFTDIENKGLLKSDKAAWLISAHGGAHIVNDANGVIESGGDSAVIWQSAEGVAASDAHYGADITNKGKITATGNAYGIRSILGAFKLDNSGAISTKNRALSIENGSLENVINNSGTISASDSDITLYANGINSIINSGTISNKRENGYAIFTGDNKDALTLLPGSTIEGIVQLSGGENTLSLGGNTGNGLFDVGKAGTSQQYRGLNNTTLYKEGSSTWTLKGFQSADQTWKAVEVKAGMLAFDKDVIFDNGGKNYAFSIKEGAAVEMGDSAVLKVNGNMAIDGTLNVGLGQRSANAAAVVTNTASFGSNSVLNVSGFATPVDATDASKAYTRALVMTSKDQFGGQTEPFSDVVIGGVSVQNERPNYISAVTHGASGEHYYLGTGLSWFAGVCKAADSECYGAIDPTVASGAFTLKNEDDAFNVDLVLNDREANGDKWDGKTLTKDGLGTLKLSQANTYTGDTLVQHGVLQMGVTDALKESASVTLVNTDASFDLNRFDQSVNNLSGFGDVKLGNATLTNHLNKDVELAGVISGDGNVKLAGNGVFTLSNDNTYTGTTTVTGSTLQLGNGSATGSVAGDIVNDGNVIFNRANDLAFDGVISGTGHVSKRNSNNLLLNKDQTYTGATAIQSGALILNRASLASSAVTVDYGAMLAGYGSVAGDVTNHGTVAIADAAPSMAGFDDSMTGDLTIKGNFINNGTVVMESPVPASTLTIDGDYIGNNGTLAIDTVLGDDASATDKLIVNGNTYGSTSVIVTNAGGVGAQTTNGIEIVNVKGESNGAFELKGRVVAGKYDYNLFKGSVEAPENGNWYLRTADAAPQPENVNPVRPEVGSYLGNQSAAVQMFQHELHDRVGEYQVTQGAKSEDGIVPAFWVRAVTHSGNYSNTSGIDNDTDTTVFQLGNDFTQWTTNGADSYHLGFMLGYGHARTDSTNPNAYAAKARKAKGTVDGYSVGAYGTWYQDAKNNTGLYIDNSLQYTWYSNEVQGSGLAAEKYDSEAWLLSTEMGYALALNQNAMQQWFIEPQAQVTFNTFKADNHTEANGTYVHNGDADGFTTRLGARLYGRLMEYGALQPTVEVNWLHGTAPNSMELSYQGVTSKSYDGMPKDRYEVKGGVQVQAFDNFRVYMNAGYQTGNNGYEDWSGLAGVRYNW